MRERSALPVWMRAIGWACVVGSVGCAGVVRWQIATMPTWAKGQIQGGFIDLFLPSPAATAMVLWEFAHAWVIVVAVALLWAKRRHVPIHPQDRILLASMVGGVMAAGFLVAELLANGCQIGVPGVDHHLSWWWR